MSDNFDMTEGARVECVVKIGGMYYIGHDGQGFSSGPALARKFTNYRDADEARQIVEEHNSGKATVAYLVTHYIEIPERGLESFKERRLYIYEVLRHLKKMATGMPWREAAMARIAALREKLALASE